MSWDKEKLTRYVLRILVLALTFPPVPVLVGCSSHQKIPSTQQTEELRQQSLKRAEAFRKAARSNNGA